MRLLVVLSLAIFVAAISFKASCAGDTCVACLGATPGCAWAGDKCADLKSIADGDDDMVLRITIVDECKDTSAKPFKDPNGEIPQPCGCMGGANCAEVPCDGDYLVADGAAHHSSHERATVFLETKATCSGTDCKSCAGTDGCAWSAGACHDMTTIQKGDDDMVLRITRAEECNDLAEDSTKPWVDSNSVVPQPCGHCAGDGKTDVPCDCDYIVADGHEMHGSHERAQVFLETKATCSGSDCKSCTGNAGCGWSAGQCLDLATIAKGDDMVLRVTRPEECNDLAEDSKTAYKDPNDRSDWEPCGCGAGDGVTPVPCDCKYIVADRHEMHGSKEAAQVGSKEAAQFFVKKSATTEKSAPKKPAFLQMSTKATCSGTDCKSCAGTAGCGWAGGKCSDLTTIEKGSDMLLRVTRVEECDDLNEDSKTAYKDPNDRSDWEPCGCGAGDGVTPVPCDCKYIVADRHEMHGSKEAANTQAFLEVRSDDYQAVPIHNAYDDLSLVEMDDQSEADARASATAVLESSEKVLQKMTDTFESAGIPKIVVASV